MSGSRKYSGSNKPKELWVGPVGFVPGRRQKEQRRRLRVTPSALELYSYDGSAAIALGMAEVSGFAPMNDEATHQPSSEDDSLASFGAKTITIVWNDQAMLLNFETAEDVRWVTGVLGQIIYHAESKIHCSRAT